MHSSAHDKDLPRLLNERKRKATEFVKDEKPKKQQLIAMALSSISQAKVNDLVANFVAGDMQAFSVVELPDFIALVNGLAPTKTVMSRKTVVGMCALITI